MRISFDLDDTLICYNPEVPREPNRVPFFCRTRLNEPLRLGTVQLMQELRSKGWEICIYTTSYRSPKDVRRWLKFYGVEIAAVINQEIHQQYAQRSQIQQHPSKYPPAFDIALHVDDLEGVKLEGALNGFEVVVLSVSDEAWVARVLEAAHQMRTTTD